MWLWICLIIGILFGLICLIPEGYEAPSDEVKVETTVNELEEWDLQDHLDELLEEEE